MPNPVDMSNLGHTRYEVDGPIGIVVIDRADKANAVNQQTLDEMDACFQAAENDPDVKVIVLRAEGKHFSSGHDMSGSDDAIGENADPEKAKDNRGLDWEERGLQAIFEWERIHYLGYSRRWRDIPKPTIAAVQGNVIAGGLMLMWVCDIIIASDDASFRDMTVEFGVNGVEWFNHPWEFGIRKAKELLFTGDAIDAAEAHRLGMVNHVVPRDELLDFTLAMAGRIAAKPSFSLKLAKMAVNQTLDAQGFQIAQQQAFGLQHVGHAHSRAEHLRETGRDMFPGAGRSRKPFETPPTD